MRHNEETFKTYDGLRLFKQWWLPDQTPKAMLAIVHGYAEHSTRYAQVAGHLVHHGYAVYAFDLRGHGRSEGNRALVRSFDEYLSDLSNFLAHIKSVEKERPLFLFGHSLGGTIVTLFTLVHKSDLRGLILSGPLLKVSDKITPLFRFFTSVAGFIFPKLPVLKKLNANLISSDPAVAKSYDQDPLVYRGKLLAREAREINHAVNRIQEKMEGISLPLLILHGTGDHLVDVEGSKALYRRAQSQDKTLKLYEGFYHEVLNEPGKKQVLADLVTWLDAHV